ncbi:major prion protein homolog [Erythrolamprus reginae]
MLEAANDIAEAIKDLYTLFTSSEGGNSRSHDGNPADSKPKGDEVKYVEETVRNAPVEDPESYILGSPIAKMFFRFNDSDEERWWNENRHRFATHVYHPNSSQPISRDFFLNVCVNVTIGEYVKPTGNQTEDELEARVVTHVTNEKCMEMYPRLTVLTTAGSYYNNKPERATTLGIKSEFKYGEKVALANSLGRASGHNPPKNAVSDLHFSFENALFLIYPFAISVITLITPFLIF